MIFMILIFFSFFWQIKKWNYKRDGSLFLKKPKNKLNPYTFYFYYLFFYFLLSSLIYLPILCYLGGISELDQVDWTFLTVPLKVSLFCLSRWQNAYLPVLFFFFWTRHKWQPSVSLWNGHTLQQKYTDIFLIKEMGRSAILSDKKSYYSIKICFNFFSIISKYLMKIIF